MSITLYSKYRRMKIRAAWEIAGMAVWCKEVGRYIAAFVLAGMAVWCKEVGKYIAALFVALLIVQYVTDKAIAEDEAYAAKQKTAHIEQAWISCLNHKGVYINDELHPCTVANTRFVKGDF